MIFKTVYRRQLFAAIVLIISIGLAVYVAIPGDSVGITENASETTSLARLIMIIDFLNGQEIVHIAGHVLLFGGVAIVLGQWGTPPEQGSTQLAIYYTLGGAVLMELGQVLVGYSDDTQTSLMLGVGFDLLVNGLAAGLGILFIQRYAAPFTAMMHRLGLA